MTEIAREDENRCFCGEIKKMIEEYKDKPEVVGALKKLGIKILDVMPAVTDWAQDYYTLFRS